MLEQLAMDYTGAASYVLCRSSYIWTMLEQLAMYYDGAASYLLMMEQLATCMDTSGLCIFVRRWCLAMQAPLCIAGKESIGSLAQLPAIAARHLLPIGDPASRASYSILPHPLG